MKLHSKTNGPENPTSIVADHTVNEDFFIRVELEGRTLSTSALRNPMTLQYQPAYCGN